MQSPGGGLDTVRAMLLVGCGGFLGSAARYLVGQWSLRASLFAGFPYGTMIVNLAGCLAIGVLGGLADGRRLLGPELRLFLFAGVLGGFTTFSSFAWETLALAREGDLARALVNVAVQVALGIGCAALGFALARG
jgi:CrcB protein